MSNAFWAAGSIIQLGDAAGAVFTDIAEVTKLTPLKMKRDSITLTSHQSPDGYEEKIPGMRDAGAVAVESNWLPTNATHNSTTGVLSTFNDNLNHHWRVVLPGSILTIGLYGHVSDFGGDLPLKEQGQLNFNIELSGKPTFTV